MFILAIDTSCDETSVAVTWNDIVLSNVISSQVELHKKYGGVVPMIAMRAHSERIDAVIEEAVRRARSQISNFQFPISKQFTNPKSKTPNKTLFSRIHDSQFTIHDIDVFAVTYGPGLAPALQVGVEKAKELAKKYKKPLVAVDHMEGHIYSNFADKIRREPTQMSTRTNAKKLPNYPITNYQFPLLCLLISGGHTELVLMKNHGEYEIVGETLDDAVGEAFDKIAKMLNLGYPGGPIVESLAREGNPFKYNFPIPLEKSKDCDFSYSGLKTSVLYTLRDISKRADLRGNGDIKIGYLTKNQICDVCASFQRVAVEHLVQKTILAVKKYFICHPKASFGIQTTKTNKKDLGSFGFLDSSSRAGMTEGGILLLGGGVVANKLVRKELRKAMKPYHIKVIYPTDKKLLGDNAAMIAVAGYYKTKRKEYVKNISKLDRMPGLRIES